MKLEFTSAVSFSGTLTAAVVVALFSVITVWFGKIWRTLIALESATYRVPVALSIVRAKGAFSKALVPTPSTVPATRVGLPA